MGRMMRRTGRPVVEVLVVGLETHCHGESGKEAQARVPVPDEPDDTELPGLDFSVGHSGEKRNGLEHTPPPTVEMQ